MFWLKFVQNFLKALNADTSPNEIAAGVTLGALLGLLPKFNLLSVLIWAVVFFFRVNFSMALASLLLFAFFGQITDPLAERIGFYLLAGAPALKPFWTALYNIPIVPFTNFNNTLVIGNLALGLVLALPVFFAARAGVVQYRTRWRDRILRWHVVQALQASKLAHTLFRWIPL